ncbi:TetR family transcriptional regulator [Modestobacter roseus]|uniref:TetR family transcriptional regulator n=1 Tax=Modestobacter roseus TaxID=1181884 RepID=A0A562IV40_9ACTN|nr:TetR family transcriptional regulator [Modestobacter roseus]
MTSTMSTTAETAARPLRRDAARNRELLLEAARTVFAQRGLEATLDDVAREAGVGVGTAYRHFANKFELATAVLEECIDVLVANAERALADEDPWRGLVSCLESAMELQAFNRGLREVLMSASDPQSMLRVKEKLEEPLTELVERAQAAGELRTDLTPGDFKMITQMVCAVAELAEGTAPQIWRRYLALLLPGLRPGGPPLPVAALSADQLDAASLAQCHRAWGPPA